MQQIFDIFKHGIKPKRFYAISFDKIKTIDKLFNKIFEIYKSGAVYLFGKDNKCNVLELNNTNLLDLRQYMNSIGIEPIIRIYNLDELDLYYSLFKKELEYLISPIKFETTTINNKINTLTLSFNIEDMNKLKYYVTSSKYKKELLDLFDFDFIKKTELIDYKYLIKTPIAYYILRFDFIY